MGENIIISVLVIMTLLFVIVLWKVILLENYVNDLDYRIKSMEMDDFLERAFKTDNQRFDLALRKGVKKLVSQELEKWRAEND